MDSAERTVDHAVERVVIVGAGLGGLRTAEALRQLGYAGTIDLVGAEVHPPYTRPPLSKEVLRGEVAPESAHLREPASYAEVGTLHVGRTATAIDPNARTVTLDDGTTLSYDAAVIATGGTPRRLPNTDHLAGVHVLRTLDDAVALGAALRAEPKPEVVVVGAGFIGSEVASSALTLGCDVTVVEVATAPLVHALGPLLGDACAALQRTSGVDLRTGVGVAGLEGTDRVTGVRLADDTVIPADVVVVGLGVTPNVEWLAGSGIAVDNGIVCDECCETTAPDVYAVGDVARWHNRLYAESMRVEHWTNATEQATAVAKAIVGLREPFAPVPYVWSDQFGLKIQVLGRPRPDDEVTVVHGTVDSGKFVALYGRDGKLVAVAGFRSPGKVMGYRPLLAESTSYDEALARAEAPRSTS